MDVNFIDGFERILLPLVTLAGGWFGHLFRSKQKKEADILDNVKQILEMQKSYIEQQAATIKETRDINKRLEGTLNRKCRSIRQANRCRYTSEGEGCPVLSQEDKNEADYCGSCEYVKHPEGLYDKS